MARCSHPSAPIHKLTVVDGNTLIAIGGLITGVVGGGAGVAAVVYAHRALSTAERSTTIASDGLHLAAEATTLSRESNSIATDARKLAEDANAYSHRSEARETERHDVRWDDGWLIPSDGIYVVTKRGDDPAYDIRVTVEFDGQEQTGRADLLEEEGAQMRFRFPRAADAYAAERAEHRAHQNASTRHNEPYGPFGMNLPPQIVSPFMPTYHHAVVRVEWVTARGTPKLWEDDHRLMTFGFH